MKRPICKWDAQRNTISMENFFRIVSSSHKPRRKRERGFVAASNDRCKRVRSVRYTTANERRTLHYEVHLGRSHPRLFPWFAPPEYRGRRRPLEKPARRVGNTQENPRMVAQSNKSLMSLSLRNFEERRHTLIAVVRFFHSIHAGCSSS